MADVSISGLTALGAAPATADLLCLVDVSDTTQAPTGTTKKMTVANLFTSPTITALNVTGGLTVASGLAVTNGGLSVSAGTTAVQALTATTGSFTDNVTLVSGAGKGILKVGTAAASTGSAVQLLGWASTNKNWQLSTTLVGTGVGLSFAPSTAAAGTTFTTDAMTLSEAGALSFSGDLAIATNKFTVAASTGNTVAAGSVTATDHIAGSANAFQWTSRSKITSPSDGNILLQNAAATAFTQLQFGGTTSAFPSLKRVGTGLVSQLADNSASASFQCQYINTDTPAGGTGAGLWKLGIRVGAAVALVTTQYIEVDIGGTLYKLATVS